MTAHPRYAIVSTDIRRDLTGPLREMKRLRLTHFYRKSSYNDLAANEVDATLVRYDSPIDLVRRLWRSQADAVQGVEPFAIRLLPYLYAVFAVALARRLPLVLVTLENRPLADKHGAMFSRLLRLALWPVVRYARVVIYLNEGAKRNLLSVGGCAPTKLRRMMYGTWGVDLAEFGPERDGREPNFGGGPVLLFVGRLHAEKGVFELLEAFRIVRSHQPQAKLILAGDGPARQEIERLIVDKGFVDAVVLTGTVKNRDLPPYFRSADVFVSPSTTTKKWEEQVGMTNIQAMACGVPVLSTRSGAIPEYVPDGVAGLLAPERDAPALAKALNELLANEALRQRMGDAGRAYAIEHYDARRNVLQAEEMLLGLVKRD